MVLEREEASVWRGITPHPAPRIRAGAPGGFRLNVRARQSRQCAAAYDASWRGWRALAYGHTFRCGSGGNVTRRPASPAQLVLAYRHTHMRCRVAGDRVRTSSLTSRNLQCRHTQT